MQSVPVMVNLLPWGTSATDCEGLSLYAADGDSELVRAIDRSHVSGIKRSMFEAVIVIVVVFIGDKAAVDGG